jgi:hypothetical protein
MRRCLAVGSAALLFVFLCLLASPTQASALSSTTTTVSCSSPVIVGSTSTCTITVTGSPSTPPTGTVDTFTSSGIGGFGAGSCTLASGQCSVNYSPTDVSDSPYTIGATYEGDSGDSPSTGQGTIVVHPFLSSITFSCNPSTVQVGVSSYCTATVTGDAPSGHALFTSSGSASVGVPANCLLVQGGSTSTCSIVVATSGMGTVNIEAQYQGDSNNAAASPVTTTLTVTLATTTTSVACAPARVVVGQITTCTATVTGDAPTGTVTWLSTDTAGVFSTNPCTLSGGSCSVSYTPTSSATITGSYSGDQDNRGSTGSFSIAVNVQESIQITVANSGPSATVTLSGCSVSPTTITANGMPWSFQAASGCSPITATLPPAGANTRYLTAAGGGSLAIGSCAANSCQAFSATIFYQVENTYQVVPASPAAWSTSGTIVVNGTALGVSGQTICKMTVTTGPGTFSCQGWTDSGTPASIGALQVSQTQRWATGETPFKDTTGGGVHTSKYFLQILENFLYSLVGSTTAPSAPPLNYTSFGSSTSVPLIGSASSVWLDAGSSWSVPATLGGSSASERWQTSVTSGSATAGQTVSLVYYHQYLVDFAYSVVGNGTEYSAPTVSFKAFGAATQGSQGWVDAGSDYNYTNPLSGSSAVERWSSPTAVGLVSGAGTITAKFYHQYAFVLSFSVLGGGIYSGPVVNYSSFGSPETEQLATTRSTVWADASTGWGLTPLLPSSTSGERWMTAATSSGTAEAPMETNFVYYHQYLGALHYSIKGTGGSPPVPVLNYTSLGARQLSNLTTSPTGFWMDSGSAWGVPLVLPGAQGEQWMANITSFAVTTVVVGTFRADVQYAHQFYLEVQANLVAGGTVGTVNGWVDQGSSVNLTATPQHLWSFAYWHGTPPSSYNGTDPTPSFTVSGPANETAIFFPGITISTQSQGAVVYSYGSVNGTVPAGTTQTVYVPPGRNITLIAAPNSVDIGFAGWTGALTGLLPQAMLAITAPAPVHASFGTDYADIRTFAIVSIIIIVAAAYVFVVRRGFTPNVMRQGRRGPG